jgi:oxygen-dependent protoporphyrinogen oxidase
MQDAIIIGGGISGLTAGYLLQQRGLDISVIEKGQTPGGPIQSVKQEGFLFEKGPNALLLPSQWVEQFIDELGLSTQLQESNPNAAKRFIVRNNRPVAVPGSLLQAVATRLFSLKAKLGFLGEPFRKRISDEDAKFETVAQFVQRRMGLEFLDYAINPFVSGVYAGDPEELVLEHAFPLMRGFERDDGSIIRGAIQNKKRQKAAGTSYKKRSISFKEGLHALPQTLGRKLGNRLWLDSEVVAINQNNQGWQVTWKRDGENFEGFAKKLLVCLPSRAIKKLAWPQAIKEHLSSTPDLPYPTVHSLALGYRRDQIAHPLDGFGVLVPSKEDPNILGVLFSSDLFSGRAPDDHCLITVMIGGRQRDDLANLAKEALIELAAKDLDKLLGVKGAPCFSHLTTWPRAIPQYTKAFGPWKRTLADIETDNPNIAFGGHAIDGIAMGASIQSGKRLADETA